MLNIIAIRTLLLLLLLFNRSELLSLYFALLYFVSKMHLPIVPLVNPDSIKADVNFSNQLFVDDVSVVLPRGEYVRAGRHIKRHRTADTVPTFSLDVFNAATFPSLDTSYHNEFYQCTVLYRRRQEENKNRSGLTIAIPSGQSVVCGNK